mmetsp:Transcript_21349/g.75219  ORF Transcript_21349/g.75219 Transcript_21349/m.75219 type:complete len:92 (+) Transcript_21349:276-551(+)
MSASRTPDECWADEGSWSGTILPADIGRTYFCKDDPRFWVPKKNRYMGWTINMAHPASSTVLTGTLLAMVAIGFAKGRTTSGVALRDVFKR